MIETLHNRSRVRIVVEMRSGNNAISKLAKVRADTKTNIMRMAVLNGLGLNVTGAAGQQRLIAMNIRQRIIGTMGKRKGEPMSIKAIICMFKGHDIDPDESIVGDIMKDKRNWLCKCHRCGLYEMHDGAILNKTVTLTKSSAYRTKMELERDVSRTI